MLVSVTEDMKMSKPSDLVQGPCLASRCGKPVGRRRRTRPRTCRSAVRYAGSDGSQKGFQYSLEERNGTG